MSRYIKVKTVCDICGAFVENRDYKFIDNPRSYDAETTKRSVVREFNLTECADVENSYEDYVCSVSDDSSLQEKGFPVVIVICPDCHIKVDNYIYSLIAKIEQKRKVKK